jgi:hypothetical protein
MNKDKKKGRGSRRRQMCQHSHREEGRAHEVNGGGISVARQVGRRRSLPGRQVQKTRPTSPLGAAPLDHRSVTRVNKGNKEGRGA